MVFIVHMVGDCLNGIGGYLKNSNGKTPLCNEGEDPDLRTTCKYLNDPKNQEIKFSIEAKLQ